MLHFRDSTPVGATWWLSKSQFGPRECWTNISERRASCIEIKLPVAPFSFIPNFETSASLLCDPRQYDGQIRFTLDTGASRTLFKGELADVLYKYTERRGRGTVRTTTDQPYGIATGILAIYICGQWVGIDCGFFLTTMDARYRLLQSEALLGMNGLLRSHMLSVTSEGVEILRRAGFK